ncbi:MAG: hypothetical protein QNJ84_10165 [Alphaproteobacteria bacterium]|nr:hypothetical protein [Alphaproteobacteria bacterium]
MTKVKNMRVRLAVLLLAAGLALSMAACGKKNAPKPPGPDPTYPKTYPKPD